MPQTSLLDDDRFLDGLLAQIVGNEKFLIRHGHLLDADDFKPKTGQKAGRDRWIVATKALQHWSATREPIGPVLSVELAKHADLSKLNERRKKELLEYSEVLVSRAGKSVKTITERFKEFKRTALVDAQLEKLLETQTTGQLNASKFLEIARETVHADARFDAEEEDLLSDTSIDERLERRIQRHTTRFIPLLIDPLDAEIRAIARGHIGLVLAPYKRGKSLMLVHLAIAYAAQGLRVQYITLEDPLEDVEDRFDAALSMIPMARLTEESDRVRRKLERFSNRVRGRIRVMDRVEEGVSVADVEQLYLRSQAQDFKADVVIIDYDDEIRPPQKRSERRHEFADIYRDLRRFASRNKIIVWTACQTQRGTGDIVKLSAEKIAEDISKVRKVALAIGIGKGEADWEAEVGDDALYLFVSAHKYDRQNVGVPIAASKDRAMIYDREKTFRVMRKLALVANGAEQNYGGRA